MEAAKVPQHLDLDDVIAFGLGATDLLFLVAGGVIAWWVYLAVPDAPLLRVVAAAVPGLSGLALGVLRLGETAFREWLALALAFALRSRVLVTGGSQ